MSLILFEVRRKETEDYLKRLYEQGGGDKYILSFSKVNKYGINVNPLDKKTPLGIYGYLLKHLFLHYDGDIRRLPFGNDRPYILVLRIKPDAKVLFVSKITDSDVKKLFQHLSDHADDNFFKQKYEYILRRNATPSETFFTLLSYIPTIFKASLSRQHILLRKVLVNLGYDIVVDDGTGLLHYVEPYQVVILNLDKAEHVETLYNPYAKTNPQEEENFHIVYHHANDPINSFIFIVLKNRLNLDDKRITDKLFFLLKKFNPFMTRKIYERFLLEVKPIIKKIYDQYDEQNYNPIEATIKYLPTFKSKLMDLSEKYHLGELFLSEIQSMMQIYLMNRDLKGYIDFFPVDIKALLNGDLLVKNLITHSIRFRLDKETITKLADLIYENWKKIIGSIPMSISITILKMSQNKMHRDFADSLIKETSILPNFSLEMIKNLIELFESKQTPIEKIVNVVAEFWKSHQLKEIENEYRNKNFSDKKQQLQWIVKKLEEFVDKVSGNLLVQNEKNLLIKTGAKELFHELNKKIRSDF